MILYLRPPAITSHSTKNGFWWFIIYLSALFPRSVTFHLLRVYCFLNSWIDKQTCKQFGVDDPLFQKKGNGIKKSDWSKKRQEEISLAAKIWAKDLIGRRKIEKEFYWSKNNRERIWLAVSGAFCIENQTLKIWGGALCQRSLLIDGPLFPKLDFYCFLFHQLGFDANGAQIRVHHPRIPYVD